MISRRFLSRSPVPGVLCALVLVLGFTSGPVLAQAQSPAEEIRALLEERDREIKEILGEAGREISPAERESLKTVINENIDFGAMGRTALGSLWADLTEEEQTDFTTTFSEVVRSQSLSDLEIYRSAVTYEQIDVSGDSAHVQTINRRDETEIPVDYELRRENGTWRVVDIVIDEVSTAESYARSFRTVIRKHGFDTLMESLRNKLEREASPSEESST